MPSFPVANYSVLMVLDQTSFALLPQLQDRFDDWYYGVPVLPYIITGAALSRLSVAPAFDPCQAGAHTLNITAFNTNGTMTTASLHLTVAPFKPPPGLGFQTNITVPSADQPHSPCTLGTAITALLPTPGIAVVLTSQVQSDQQLVTYGVRDAVTLEWVGSPWAVDGAAVAQQLGYTQPSDPAPAASAEGGHLLVVIAVLGSLSLLSLLLLLLLRVYYKKRDRTRSQHAKTLDELAN